VTVVDHSARGLLIGGAWREGGGAPFGSWNPATGALVDVFAAADDRDVDDAIAAARAAAPAWAALPRAERAALLLRGLEELERDAAALCETLTREIGATAREARAEVAEAIGRIRAGLTSSDPPGRSLGHTGLVTPWQSPLAVGLCRAFAELVAGNTVCWKPAPYASVVTVSAVRRLAALPVGALNLVLGGGDVALALARTELAGFQLVGTAAAARWLCGEALEAGTRVAAAVAGPGTAVVFGDADLALAAREIVASACSLAGQRSGAMRFVLTGQRTAPALLRALGEAMAGVTTGDPARSDVTIGPLVSREAAQEFAGAVDEAVAAGAERLAGGRLLQELGETFVETALLIGQTPVTEAGPVVVVRIADELDPAVELPPPVCLVAFGGGDGRAAALAEAVGAAVVRFDESSPPDVFETLLGEREAVHGASWMRSPLIRRREEMQ
jgi:acyl-CoA reductase-like NAD-dependent aldehyde dehydrogenase